MRRAIVLMFAALLLVGANPAAAHRQESRIDNHNRKSGLDLRQAVLDHDGTYFYGQITTFGGFSKATLRRRGVLWFHFWRGKYREGFYTVAMFSRNGQIKGRVYRNRAGQNGVRVGSARVFKEASNEIGFRVKRSAVGGRGRGVKWRAVSGWHLKSCDDIYYCYTDGVPTPRGAKPNYYWHRF